MAYVRYHETEKLFTAWPELEAIYESLSRDLNSVRTKDSMGIGDDYIYSLCIGNKAFDNIPTSGKISDSTGSVAANYSKMMRHDRKAVRQELTIEILELGAVISKLNLAFRRLSSLQREVLTLHYRDNILDKKIAKVLNCNVSQVKDKRRFGIEKMKQVMRLTIEKYERVMNMVEERRNDIR